MELLIKGFSELELSDFKEIKDFKKYKELHNLPGIYVFLSNEPVQRLVGSSRVLKIGQTNNLRRRMSAYFREENIESLKLKKSRQTAYRMSRYLFDKDNYTILFMEVEKEHLKRIERDMLISYFESHYESPPLNMGLT